ncbi:MAG: sulfotransferase family 2 domain-containing protein [Archaeoglobaceae archaeon]
MKSMIISHKHKFIFIKTKKTAGTSVESYLAQFCGENDLVAPHEYLVGQNYGGFFNPLIDLRFYLKNGRNDMFDLIYNLRNGQNGNGSSLTLKKLLDLRRGLRYHQHLPALIVRSRVGKDIWNNYFKFCFERNPWDKVLSHYSHKCVERNKRIPFDDFMNDPVYWQWPMNHLLYSDFSDNSIVDHIGRFENLKEDLKNVLDRLGIPLGELPEHRSDTIKHGKSYQEFFSNGFQEHADKISDFYKKEIELHRYRF